MNSRCLTLLLLCATILCASPVAAEEPITIGAVVSVTGPAAEQGKNWLQGATLAIEDLQAEGAQVILQVEDDGTNPVQAVAAFKRLQLRGNLAGVVGGTWDFLAAALYPLAQESRIPFITPTNPPEIVADGAKGNPWVFTNGLSLQATEAVLARFISRRNPRSCAILVPAVPFGALHAEVVDRLCRTSKARVISNESFEFSGYLDTIRGWANRVAPQKPDLIFMLSEYSALDVFMRELERLRVTAAVVTTQHLDEAAKLSRNPSRYERAFGVYPRPPAQSFISRFKKRFGHEPKVYSVEGYDAVGFLVTAHRAGARPPPPGLEYQGVSGLHRVQEGMPALLGASAVLMQIDADGALRIVTE